MVDEAGCLERPASVKARGLKVVRLERAALRDEGSTDSYCHRTIFRQCFDVSTTEIFDYVQTRNHPLPGASPSRYAWASGTRISDLISVGPTETTSSSSEGISSPSKPKRAGAEIPSGSASTVLSFRFIVLVR